MGSKGNRHGFLVLAWITVSIKVLSTWGITTTKSMTSMEKAHLPVYVNDSLILILTEEILTDHPDKFLQITTEVVTEPDKRLLLHFLSLDISFDNETPDRLHIFDYPDKNKVTRLTPVMGVFGVYDSYYKNTSPGVKDYISSQNKLRLNYMGRPTMAYSGFRVLITSFRDSTPSGACPYRHRKCRSSQICVPLSVMCDSDYNCGMGDTSDEDTCHLIPPNDEKKNEAIVTAVVTAVIAISVFLLVLMAAFCYMKRYNNRNYVRRQSLQVVAKRHSNGDWLITDNMTSLYAPPTYEDVVTKEDEPPPSYETVANSPTVSRAGSRRSREPSCQGTTNEQSVVVHIENMVCHNITVGSDNESEEHDESDEENAAADVSGSLDVNNVSISQSELKESGRYSKTDTATACSVEGDESEVIRLLNDMDEESSDYSDGINMKGDSSESLSSCNEHKCHNKFNNSFSSGICHDEEDECCDVTSDSCNRPITKQASSASGRMFLVNCDEIEYIDDGAND